MKPASLRPLGLAALVLALTTFIAACGGDDSTGPPSTGPFTGTITIGDDFFSPSSVTINAGDSVTWVWKGSHSHSATSNPGDPFSYDSGIKTSGKFGFRFATAGTSHYHCQVHSNMNGTITVKS
jgi:plastocyanin